MIYIIIGICALVLVWLFFPRKVPKGRPGRTKSATYAAVTKAFDTVRRRGLDRARIIINKHDSKEFIQFVKWIQDGRLPNVIFYFPIADFSTEYVDSLKKELVSAGIDYRIREADTTLPQRWVPDYVKCVEEFVEVDCAIDLEKALAILDMSLNVMGLSKGSPFDILLFHPISVFKKAVGFEE